MESKTKSVSAIPVGEVVPIRMVTYAAFVGMELRASKLEAELAESKKKAFAYKTAFEQSESELIDARAEIERIEKENAELRADNKQIGSDKLMLTIEAQERGRLIEQMRVALAWLYQWTKNEVEHFGAAAPDDEIVKDVEAALSAAERGE